jgi:hypothetical protein
MAGDPDLKFRDETNQDDFPEFHHKGTKTRRSIPGIWMGIFLCPRAFVVKFSSGSPRRSAMRGVH